MVGGAEAFLSKTTPEVYQCYYRYTDDTPEEREPKSPSNLSEVYELDAGEAAQHNLELDTERADEPCDTRRALEEHQRPSNNDVPSSTDTSIKWNYNLS